MAQAPPLNITPQLSNGLPYSASNNPYVQMNPVVAALAQTANGAANATQPQAAASGGAPPAPGLTPNYGQAGQQLGGNLVNMIGALAGSTPAFGGGNILSGDAYGGNAANPLPGLDESDYG